MSKRSEDVKRAEWRKRIGKYAESDLTIAEFCRREHVSEASFYYWAKRIRQAGQFDAPQRAPRTTSAAMSNSAVPNDVVEVLVGDSIRVRMPANRLGAVVALIRDLQAGFVDDVMTTSRFQRIQLAAPSTQP